MDLAGVVVPTLRGILATLQGLGSQAEAGTGLASMGSFPLASSPVHAAEGSAIQVGWHQEMVEAAEKLPE